MNPNASSHGFWFPFWSEALVPSRWRDFERRADRLAIFESLRFGKRSRQRATLTSARIFMPQVAARRRLSFAQMDTWKAALSWFFKSAKSPVLNPPMPASQQPAAPATHSHVPPLAARDLGGPPWEQMLIRELRSRHYEWRAE